MKKALIAATLAFFAGASHAATYTLTFDEANICTTNADGTPSADAACGNGRYIQETYGDVAGVVDVVYTQPDQQTQPSLFWWNADYNELHGVLWANSSDADSHARIDLHALDGPLALTHFDMGAYSHTSRGTTLDIYDLGTGASLFHYAGPIGIQPGDHSTPFDFALVSAAGFRIDWRNSAFNVGIDNISFASAALIPEPQTYAMVIAGLALLGFVAKRRASAL